MDRRGRRAVYRDGHPGPGIGAAAWTHDADEDAAAAELETRGIALDEPGTAAAVTGLGPTAIFGALLARLPPDAIALADAAAVLGAHSEPWVAGKVAGLHDARLAGAMDALVAGHVLTADQQQLAFLHPVVREAILKRIGPGERASLHAKAAETLHAAGAAAARVAAHLAFSPIGTLPDAAAVLREAAIGLLSDGDAVTAAAHLGRALDETPTDHGLRAELGFALLRAGEPASAREHLRAAARAATTPRERADRLVRAASATSLLDGPTAAVAELRAQLDAWPESDGESGRLVLEARLASICSLLPGESQRSVQRLLQFADLPGRTPDERTLLALLAQGERYCKRPASEVATLAARALGEGALLEDVADGADGMVGWVVAVMALIATDAIGLAEAEIDRARTRVRGRGSPLEFGFVSMLAGWLAWRTGDVTAAEAEAEATLAAVADEERGAQVMAIRATALHFGILATLERGDPSAAVNALAAFDALQAEATQLIPATRLSDSRALVALASDEPARAYEEAMSLGDAVLAADLDMPAVPWRTTAARAALRLGQDDQARALTREHLELSRLWGTSSDIGAGLRVLARIEAERRVDLLAEAIAVLEESPSRLELAGALVDLGEALRVARRRKDAHDPLRRGADLAVACGSRVLRQRALDGLASLGDRPRKLMFSGHESLTASERRVAQLAVDGRSNRDIAQELFVTPKTVENQLGRAYIKLGITGRRQLAEAMG